MFPSFSLFKIVCKVHRCAHCVYKHACGFASCDLDLQGRWHDSVTLPMLYKLLTPTYKTQIFIFHL